MYSGRGSASYSKGFTGMTMNSPQGSQRIENWLGASIAGIISVDDNRNIVFWNKGAENIFQYSSEEIIGQPIMVLVPPDRLEKEAEKIVSALNTQGFLENHQTVGRRKDGSEFPVHVTISGIKNEEGVLIGGTYVFGDLTEQVKIGTEMRRLAATIESVSDLIIIADLENKIVYTNPAALQRFGYTSDEMLGQAASIVVPPEQKEIARELAIKTRTEGHWSGEVVNITKTGDRLHVLLNTAVVRDSNGEILALVGMGKDITNLKQAEEQIRTYATELEKVNETLRSTQQQLVQSEKQAALGILASGIAHEIGNPLASISSLIQLATRRTNDTNVQGTMSQVATHVERISKIIRSLVDL